MTIQNPTIYKETRVFDMKVAPLSIYPLSLYFLVCTVIQPAIGYLSEHLGLIPEIETGWALVKIVFLGLALLLGGPRFLYNIRGITGFMGAFLLLWIILLQIIQAPAMSWNFPSEIRRVLGNTLLTGPGLWLAGVSAAPMWRYFKTHRSWRIYSFGAFTFYAIVIILGIIETFHRYGVLIGIYRNPAGEISYLEIADSFVIIAFWTASLISQPRVIYGILTLCGILLFFCLSRASFYAYLVTLITIMLIRACSQRGTARPWLLTGILLILLVVLPLVQTIPVAWSSHRMVTIIRSPSTDESLQLREYHLAEGLERLAKHWLLGNFMAEVTVGEGLGTYMHNWLSFWEAYGLGPFLLSLIVFAVSCFRGVRVIMQESPLFGYNLFAVCVCFFCVVCVVFARSYIWPYAWLAIGLTTAGEFWRYRNANSLLRSR